MSLHTLQGTRALGCWLLALPMMLPALAQRSSGRSWQVLNLPTTAEVAAGWASPPPEYGPEPYYGLNGRMTLDDVRRDLDTIKRLGFGAVTVQYGAGSNLAYLSPEYFTFFRQFVAEAKLRGLRVWIVDDAGYPSGFAGGKFSSEHPELRMQALMARVESVAGGSVYSAEVPAETVVVTATETSSGQTVPVPVANGRADWTAPPGNWRVAVVEHVFRTSPTRSDTNPNRVKDTSQSLEDYLDPAATRQYLAFTHEAYARAVGDEFGKTILGFRGDEPDYSIAGLPWTPQFFAAFQARKGYDIRPYLAALLQPRSAVLLPREQLAKADYYDVFADLFRDGFFKPQAEWCAAHGLEYQVHLNHEEAELDLARSEGDFFRDMRFVEVPGIDTIWHQIWTDTVSDFPRLASSAAHVYGHRRAFTESFAAYRPEPDLAMARYILNEQMVRGVNLVETMYFPSSAGGRGGPGDLMRDPGWPDLMHQVARTSFLLSQGHPAAEVTLLLPSSSLWMGSVATDDQFVATERLLSEHQIDFDVVDEDALASLLPLDGGAFVSLSGNRYRTVLVPDAVILSKTLVDRLQHFARAGGHVVFLGSAPGQIAAKNDLDARPAVARDFGWSTVLPGTLPRVPTPPAQPPASAPVPMEVPHGFWEAVARQLPQQTVTTAVPTPGLRILERRLSDGDVLMLFNESATAIQTDALLHVSGTCSVEEWNPQTGKANRLEWKRSGTAVSMPLTLPAYGTQLLVLAQSSSTGVGSAKDGPCR